MWSRQERTTMARFLIYSRHFACRNYHTREDNEKKRESTKIIIDFCSLLQLLEWPVAHDKRMACTISYSFILAALFCCDVVVWAIREG